MSVFSYMSEAKKRHSSGKNNNLFLITVCVAKPLFSSVMLTL